MLQWPGNFQEDVYKRQLTFLHKCHLSNARITRWILCIQEYDFDIVHCKGKENIVANILSRNPEDAMDSSDVSFSEEMEINRITLKLDKKIVKDIKNIEKLQRQDPKLNKIICELESKEDSKLSNKYQYVKKILYRQDKKSWKIYVPNNMKENLIQELHVVYGHCGIQKTERLFREYFTGDRINKTIHQIITKCDTCQRCKDHHKNNVGETIPMLPKKKGELISMDYYGPVSYTHLDVYKRQSIQSVIFVICYNLIN